MRPKTSVSDSLGVPRLDRERALIAGRTLLAQSNPADDRGKRMAAPLKVLVFDDEPFAREALSRELRNLAGVGEVLEAADQQVGFRLLASQHPDVIFAGVHSPDSAVFEFMKRLAGVEASPPPVVLVAAHSGYAVKAFEHQAADCLLKPFTHARLEQALNAARERILNSEVHNILRALPELLRNEKQQSPRLAVKTTGRIIFLSPAEVEWIQANGNYVTLHCSNGSHSIRGTLVEIENALDPRQFLRIHRSVIVNKDCVREVRPWPTGEYVLHLCNGKELTVTRKYKQNLARIAAQGLGRDVFRSEE
jgi:two-component system LytT family response regulator